MKSQAEFRKFNFITIILVLSALIGFPKTIQGQDDVIRVDTDLVTIPTKGLDRDGRYVTDLKKEDFQIFEDVSNRKLRFSNLSSNCLPFLYY